MKTVSRLTAFLFLVCIVLSGCNGNNTKLEDVKGHVSLKVTCQSAVDSGKREEKGLKKVIPKDGIIYENTEAEFAENETVLDVLQRELSSKNIILNFSNGYVNGIGGLNEKDCGPESGWAYFVNGEMPMDASNVHTVNDGDTIELRYLCTYAEWGF